MDLSLYSVSVHACSGVEACTSSVLFSSVYQLPYFAEVGKEERGQDSVVIIVLGY